MYFHSLYISHVFLLSLELTVGRTVQSQNVSRHGYMNWVAWQSEDGIWSICSCGDLGWPLYAKMSTHFINVSLSISSSCRPHHSFTANFDDIVRLSGRKTSIYVFGQLCHHQPTTTCTLCCNILDTYYQFIVCWLWGFKLYHARNGKHEIHCMGLNVNLIITSRSPTYIHIFDISKSTQI